MPWASGKSTVEVYVCSGCGTHDWASLFKKGGVEHYASQNKVCGTWQVLGTVEEGQHSSADSAARALQRKERW